MFYKAILSLLLLLWSFKRQQWQSPSSSSPSLSLFAVAFSRENREIAIQFETTGGGAVIVHMDPFINTARNLAREACDTLGCNDVDESAEERRKDNDILDHQAKDEMKADTATQAMEKTLNRHLLLETYRYTRETYLSYEQETLYMKDNELRDGWLSIASASLRQKSNHLNEEVKYLLQGKMLPQIKCHVQNETKDDIDNIHTSYKKILSRNCALDYYSDKLLKQAEVTLKDYLDLSETLFNEGLYAHAEAISYFTLSMLWFDEDANISLQPKNWYKNISLNGVIDVDIHRSLLVLTESLRAQGQVVASTHFARAMIVYMNYLPSKLILYRLRAIMSLPPIPPSYEISRSQRDNIENDMLKMIDELGNGVIIKLTELVREVHSTPFYLAHQGLNDRPFMELLSTVFSKICPELHYIAPHLLLPSSSSILSSSSSSSSSVSKSSTGAAIRGDKIKVGFISNHFFDHSIGRIMMNTIRFVDSDTDIMTYVLYMRRNVAGDYITDNYKNFLGDRYLDIPCDTFKARSAVEALELDILIYTDIGMDFTTYALAYSRLAKYQIAWWGHPITSGIDTIDYYFGLDIEIEDAATLHYSEQLVRMRTMNTVPSIPRSNRTPSVESMKILNFTEHPDVRYCAIIGRLFKIHPTFDEAIIKILQNTDRNTFIVLIAESVISLNRILYQRFKVSFSNYNALHLLPRVKLVDFSLYTELLNSAKCILDTFPYGGCLTTHDALAFGVPMVTLPLEHVRGRYTLGMYKQMNITELVAKDVDDFVSITIRLLTNETHQKQLSKDVLDLYFREDAVTHEVDSALSTRLHRNTEVATEWANFFKAVMRHSN